MVFAMAKIADFQGHRAMLWGGIVLALGLVSMVLVELPFLRLLMAGVVAIILMSALGDRIG